MNTVAVPVVCPDDVKVDCLQPVHLQRTCQHCQPSLVVHVEHVHQPCLLSVTSSTVQIPPPPSLHQKGKKDIFLSPIQSWSRPPMVLGSALRPSLSFVSLQSVTRTQKASPPDPPRGCAGLSRGIAEVKGVVTVAEASTKTVGR